jgi:hypothetical protein
MKTLPRCVILACLLATTSILNAAEVEKGFTSIFNGKDLTGWEGMPGMWTVKDGAITPKQSTINNWVFWRGGQPADFELRLSFRYHSGNSGVQVRTIEFEPFQSRGYQVEVAPQAKMGLWHHSKAPAKSRHKLALAGEETVYAKDGTKSIKKVADPDKVKSAYKENGWNELVVIAKGPTLIQKINGVVFSQLTDYDEKYSTAKGWIAFQDHGKGTKVEFKNIRIRIDK